MAEHDDRGEYNNKMPKPAPVPDCCGYPNPKPSKKPVKVRGTGAAKAGIHASSKMG